MFQMTLIYYGWRPTLWWPVMSTPKQFYLSMNHCRKLWGLIWILLFTMRYLCRSLSCNEEFLTQRGLTAHRNSCGYYKRHELAAFERRKKIAQDQRVRKNKVRLALERKRQNVSFCYLFDQKSWLDCNKISNDLVECNIEIDNSEPISNADTVHLQDALSGDPQIHSSSPPALTKSGRPQRHYRLPARYEDITPEGPARIPQPVSTAPAPTPSIRRVILHVRDLLRTGTNRFGILREYPHRPSYDPDDFVSIEDLSNISRLRSAPAGGGGGHTSTKSPPWPFKNWSVYLLTDWWNTGSSQKSSGEVDRLVTEVLGAKEFQVEDLAGFKAQRENQRLDYPNTEGQGFPFSGDGWTETVISISVPTGFKDPNGQGQSFAIPGLHHRSLLDVMKAALADVTALRFHYFPFKRFWTSPSGSEIRVYDEAYTCDTFLQANEMLQKQPNEDGCKLEKVVLGLMFWSDSTHLSSFGTAKVWPLYMYFANLSKYFRGKPGSGAAHHVAYIPSVGSLRLVTWVGVYCLTAPGQHSGYHLIRQPVNSPSHPLPSWAHAKGLGDNSWRRFCVCI